MLFLPPDGARVFFHLLAFALVVLAPVCCWAVSRKIQAAPSPRARIWGYATGSIALLLGSVAVFLLIPPGIFFDIQIKNRGVTWLPSRELISALAIALVLLTTLPALLARRGGPFQVDFERQIHDLRNLLPHGRSENAWFAFAAVMAGIGEEVLYRGYLLHYLHVFPWRLNIATSLAIACLVFGMVHLYQGWSGILQTVLLALGLCVLFLSTRSLLFPILLHVLVDLRIFLVLPVLLNTKD